MNKHILITGASRGLGKSLALQYGRPGNVLGLVARNHKRLAEIERQLQEQGAQVHLFPADVGDTHAMHTVAEEFLKAVGHVDLVVANAGIVRNDRLENGDATEASEMIRINLIGTVNTFTPFIPAMLQQKQGHLVCISSIAGYRGMKGIGAYCASKGAQRILMDGYRASLKSQGIRVSTIAPGWIRTEMTQENPHPMPFLMSVERAAQRVFRALERGKEHYVFPLPMRIGAALFMPYVPQRFMPSYSNWN